MSPIILRLNYTLVGEPLRSSRDLRPVLAMEAQRIFTAMVSPGVGAPQEERIEQGGLARTLLFYVTSFKHFIVPLTISFTLLLIILFF